MSNQDLISLFPELRLSREQFLLEDGNDRLILSNVLPFDPIYFERGGNYVKDFLAGIGKGARTADLLGARPENEELITMLLAHGILQTTDTRMDDRAYRRYALPPDCKPPGINREKPIYVLYLLVSQACNMACVYCLAGRDTYQNVDQLQMPEKVAFDSIRASLDALAADGELEISFFGGEPLLNWPLCKKCILYTEQLRKTEYPGVKVHYHLTTNLSVLPNDIEGWATKYDISFLVELDGPKEEHDLTRPYKKGGSAYADIVRNVKRLLKGGYNVMLRTTVTSRNHHSMLKIAEHHLDVGVSHISFVPLNPVNSDLNIFEPELLPDPEVFAAGLEEIYRARLAPPENFFPLNEYLTHIAPGAATPLGCGMPFGNTPVVNTDGEVYACIWLMGQPQFKIGDLKSRFIEEEVLIRFFRELHVDNLPKCSTCQWRFLCGGGCPVRRMSVEPNEGADPRVLNYYDKLTCLQAKTALSLLLWDKARDRQYEVKRDNPNWGCLGPTPVSS